MIRERLANAPGPEECLGTPLSQRSDCDCDKWATSRMILHYDTKLSGEGSEWLLAELLPKYFMVVTGLDTEMHELDPKGNLFNAAMCRTGISTIAMTKMAAKDTKVPKISIHMHESLQTMLRAVRHAEISTSSSRSTPQGYSWLIVLQDDQSFFFGDR